MKIENYKTLCCKAPWTVKGRAIFICSKCGEDVTYEIVLLNSLYI